ncbi:cytochrome c family protein [Maribacter aurantiacus]|uniref:Cytochrome c n=1 Tax=Maribacter aurantiacus TaxID=1882343 RepID=A0A5R8LRI5_9FLAO|nr:cytochrome c [Maribacter aurantiacus]TLF39864.1 cytochrome c [Maribacter aurantiacus]
MKTDKTLIFFAIILVLMVSMIYLLANGFGIKSANEKIDFGAFEMTIPHDWKKIEFKGIDSYVGGITNGIDSLTFDYGWYSYDFKYENGETQLFATDTINGKIALLTKPKEVGKGTIGVYIEKAYKKNRFNLIGNNIDDENLIFNIFKSIKFKDSDTLLNSKQIEFSNKITPYSGRSLFYINCASCHHRNKNMIGPAFRGINELKFKKWILDSADLTKEDTTEFGISYHRKTFGKLITEKEIEKLIEYSKAE